MEGVKAELLARIEELLSLQQANDAKASVYRKVLDSMHRLPHPLSGYR